MTIIQHFICQNLVKLVEKTKKIEKKQN